MNKTTILTFLACFGLSFLVSAQNLQQTPTAKNRAPQIQAAGITNVEVASPLPKISIPGDEVILSESFEDATFPPPGWHQEVVDTTGSVMPEWFSAEDVATHGVNPVEGIHLAYMNSLDNYMSSARLVIDSLDFSGVGFVYLDFFMYHAQLSTIGCDENLKIQLSLDGENWETIGDPFYVRDKDLATGWYNHQLDLSAYAGQDLVHLGILGQSSNRCYTIIIDSLQVKSNPVDDARPIAVSFEITDASSEDVSLTGIAIANAASGEVIFEVDTLNDFSTAIQSESFEISGFFPHEVSASILVDKHSTTYYGRMIVSNSVGDSISDPDNISTTGFGNPVIDYYNLLGNDGNQVFIEAYVNPNNSITTAWMSYGTDKDLMERVDGAPAGFKAGGIVNLVATGFQTGVQYYYQIAAGSSRDTAYSVIDSLTIPEFIYDTLINNNAFLKGRYVNLGINQKGALGTGSSAPNDMHSRADWGALGGPLGFVADPGMDGWYTGDPGFIGDYFYPGSPEEGWGVTIAGSDYNNNTDSEFEISGALDGVKDSVGYHIADWSGSILGLAIEQRVKLPADSLYFVFEATVTNETDSTYYDVYYMRNVDPDNELTVTNVFDTYNIIENQNPNDDNVAFVSATGLGYDSYMGLCANDKRARVTHGGFDNRSAAGIWHGLDLNTYGETYQDEAISLAFKIDSLQPGECTTLIYAYVLSESQIASALRATMISLGVSGEAGISGDVAICSGGNATLRITNGEDFAWVWTDSEGAILSTDISLDLTNITDEAIYEATGSLQCFDTTFSISVVPVPYPIGTVSTDAQTIESGDSFADIVPGTSNGVEGTTFLWTRNNPGDLETTLPESGELAEGESIEGVTMSNTGDSDVNLEFTLIPVGPEPAYCEGDPVMATLTVNPVVDVLETVDANRILLYPNPSNGQFRMEFSKEGTLADVKVVNIAGQLIYSVEEFRTGSLIDLQEVGNGIYFVLIQTDNFSERMRIVIQ